MDSDEELKYWCKIHNILFDDIKNDKISHLEAKRRQHDLYTMSSGNALINPYGLEILMKEKYEGGEPYKPLFSREPRKPDTPMTDEEIKMDDERKRFMANLRK